MDPESIDIQRCRDLIFFAVMQHHRRNRAGRYRNVAAACFDLLLRIEFQGSQIMDVVIQVKSDHGSIQGIQYSKRIASGRIWNEDVAVQFFLR